MEFRGVQSIGAGKQFASWKNWGTQIMHISMKFGGRKICKVAYKMSKNCLQLELLLGELTTFPFTPNWLWME